jgi:hypothetical protein
MFYKEVNVNKNYTGRAQVIISILNVPMSRRTGRFTFSTVAIFGRPTLSPTVHAVQCPTAIDHFA